MDIRKAKLFEELEITDDFMFGAVMSDPDNLKPLLEYILNIKIKEITYPERQKVIDLMYGAKGVRLDVYCEDEKKTVYSIEIQVMDCKNLAKRIRYYHGMIDLNILDKGMNYNKLRKSYVIFICCYDPFGLNRYMYTFKKQCQEVPELYLRDEADSIVLNVNGTVGEIRDELKSTLQYMAGQEPAEGYAQTLDAAVKAVKGNEKWRRDYMTFAMKIQETKDVALLTKTVSAIRNGKGKGQDDFIMQILKIEKQTFDEIANMIDTHPDMSDEDIAIAIVNF